MKAKQNVWEIRNSGIPNEVDLLRDGVVVLEGVPRDKADSVMLIDKTVPEIVASYKAIRRAKTDLDEDRILQNHFLKNALREIRDLQFHPFTTQNHVLALGIARAALSHFPESGDPGKPS